MNFIPSAPSAAPSSVSVSTVTSSNITVQWGTVDCIHRNGDITGYEVLWQRDISGECSDEDEGSVTITGDSTNYDIMGLEEDSSYSISVTASNAAGSSEVSSTVTAMTLEAGEIFLKI